MSVPKSIVRVPLDCCWPRVKPDAGSIAASEKKERHTVAKKGMVMSCPVGGSRAVSNAWEVARTRTDPCTEKDRCTGSARRGFLPCDKFEDDRAEVEIVSDIRLVPWEVAVVVEGNRPPKTGDISSAPVAAGSLGVKPPSLDGVLLPGVEGLEVVGLNARYIVFVWPASMLTLMSCVPLSHIDDADTDEADEEPASESSDDQNTNWSSKSDATSMSTVELETFRSPKERMRFRPAALSK